MTKIISDPAALHPKLSGLARELQQRVTGLHKSTRMKTRFEIFETFRSFERQRDLFSKRVEVIRPYHSPYQFGLAVNFVAVIDGPEANALSEMTGERHWPGWSWHSSHEWEQFREIAQGFGFSTGLLGHCEHPQWPELYEQLQRLELLV